MFAVAVAHRLALVALEGAPEVALVEVLVGEAPEGEAVVWVVQEAQHGFHLAVASGCKQATGMICTHKRPREGSKRNTTTHSHVVMISLYVWSCPVLLQNSYAGTHTQLSKCRKLVHMSS